MELKTGIIIQARMSSSRLPNKIMLELAKKPILWHVVERCKKADVDDVIIATSINKENDVIEEFCKENNYLCYRGSEDDVLDRYYNAAIKFKLDVIVRITSDCPLVSPRLINKCLNIFEERDIDYIGNARKRSFPRGLDLEIFSLKALEREWNLTTEKIHREHVTAFIYANPEMFRIEDLMAEGEFEKFKRPNLRLTVDTSEDFKLLSIIYDNLYKAGKIISIEEVVDFLDKNPELEKINTNSEIEHLNRSMDLKQKIIDLDKEIKIRKAEKEDIGFLFQLRNNPEVYKYFKNPCPITYEEHINWITPILKDEKKDRLLYVILYNKERAGQTRLDIEKDSTEISISIHPDYQGKGIGNKAVKLTIEEAKKMEIKKLIAEIKKKNVGSLALFKKNNFNYVRTEEDLEIFEYLF